MLRHSITFKVCLIIAIALLGLNAYLTLGDFARPSYAVFSNQAQGIYEQLKEHYQVTEESYSLINIQPYLGNFEKRWSNTIGDTFETVEGNQLIIGDSKKREIFVMPSNQALIAKVSLNYDPETKGKRFIGINHINEVSDKMAGLQSKLPRSYQETFTADGLIVQVTILPIKALEVTEEVELIMMDLLDEVVTSIQKTIVEMERIR